MPATWVDDRASMTADAVARMPVRFGSTIRTVRKIRAEDFTPAHRDVLQQAPLTDQRLFVPAPAWQSVCLGSGEEKAVCAVSDAEERVFACEVIDEKGGSYRGSWHRGDSHRFRDE